MTELALSLLTALCALCAYALYILGKVKSAATGAVADAEKEDRTGHEKFGEAVDAVYKLVPVAFRILIDRPMVEGIVQTAFNKIEEYARKQK